MHLKSITTPNRRTICPTEKHPKQICTLQRAKMLKPISKHPLPPLISSWPYICCTLKTGYETRYDFQQSLTGPAIHLCSRWAFRWRCPTCRKPARMFQKDGAGRKQRKFVCSGFTFYMPGSPQCPFSWGIEHQEMQKNALTEQQPVLLQQ